MKRNLNNLIRKTINESKLLLEGLPCDGKQRSKKSRRSCTRCLDDYYDAHDAGNPSEPLYGASGVCGGGKVVDPSNDDWRDRRRSKSAGPETRFDFEDELRINESNLLSERMDCWSRGKYNRGGCRIDIGTDSSSGCMSYNECEETKEDDRVSGGNKYCVRHNGNQSGGYKPGFNRCLEWSGSKSSPVEWWEKDEEVGYSVSGGEECCILRGTDDGCLEYGPCGVRMAESELIDTIERIVNEQMMLGFGNTQGMSLGITKPSDKYEEELEEELEEDDTTGTTYNVNVSNKSADPNYTDDGMGMFESILRNNIMKYKNR